MEAHQDGSKWQNMLSPTWQPRVGVRHSQESGQKDEDSHHDVDQGVLPHPHAQRSLRWRCGPPTMASPSPPHLPQFLSGLLQLCLQPPSSVPVQVHQQLCLCHLEPPHLGDRGHPLVPPQCVGLGTAVEPHPPSPVPFSPVRCGRGASGQGPPGS